MSNATDELPKRHRKDSSQKLTGQKMISPSRNRTGLSRALSRQMPMTSGGATDTPMKIDVIRCYKGNSITYIAVVFQIFGPGRALLPFLSNQTSLPWTAGTLTRLRL